MQRLFDAFAAAGRELYLVGGAVRDLAMGRSMVDLDDLDFATNCRPQETLKIVRDARLRTYTMGIEFGTVGAVLTGKKKDGYPKDVQITTYRSSEYYRRGSRHPVVQFGDSIEQDLARRDFSINSIAMDAEGNFVDPHDGLGDIERRTLRVISDPYETLAEDPLRILRVARFMARLGFAPTHDLQRAAHAKATWLLDISQQRWIQELTKILKGAYVRDALEFLLKSRALGVVLPEVVALVGLHDRSPGPAHADLWEQTLKLVAAAGDDPELSWAGLLLNTGRAWTRAYDDAAESVPGPVLVGLAPTASNLSGGVTFDRYHLASTLLAKGIGRRLHFDNNTSHVVEGMLKFHTAVLAYETSWPDKRVRRLVRDLDPLTDRIVDFAALLQETDRQPGADPRAVAHLRERLEALKQSGRLRPSLPSGLGKVVMRHFDLPAGPGVGEVLGWLNEAIIDGQLESDLDPAAYVHYLEAERPQVLNRARELAGPSRRTKGHGKTS